MIPILFEYNATNFTSHGLGDLIDCISCEAICNADGEYELSLQYPVSSPMFSELTINRIVYAKANDYHPWQAFRIYGYEKEIRGVQTIKCQHISYDLHCIPTREIPKSMNVTSCNTALSLMKSQAFAACPFTFYTDITRLPHMEEHKFASDNPTSIRAMLLDGDDSIHGSFGGDLVFNNYDVFLMQMAGEDRGVTIDYGVDLVDLDQEENISEMITGVLPYFRWNEANEDSSSEDYGDTTDHIAYGTVQYCPGTFQRQNIQALDLTDQFPNQDQGTYPPVAALDAKAQEWISESDVGHPIISLTVNYATLGQDVRIHDAVTVRFHEMGIDVKSKVTSYKYDVLAERPVEIEIGKTKSSSMFSLEDASRLKKGLIPPKRIQKKSIGQDQIQNGGVGGKEISAAGVGSTHLKDKAVQENKIDDYAVTRYKIKNGEIVEEKIHVDAVTREKIHDYAVNLDKLDEEMQIFWADLVWAYAIWADVIDVKKGATIGYVTTPNIKASTADITYLYVSKEQYTGRYFSYVYGGCEFKGWTSVNVQIGDYSVDIPVPTYGPVDNTTQFNAKFLASVPNPWE